MIIAKIFPAHNFFSKGLDDWGEDAVLHQVLAASQQEYLDSLKKKDDTTDDSKDEKQWKSKNKSS